MYADPKKAKECWQRWHKENDRKRYDKMHFGGNRESALIRDNYTCQECGMTNEEHKIKYGQHITVDHIDGNGRNSSVKNNELENLRTLCSSCHGKKDVRRRKFHPVV